jgi:DNA/RNA-binding domain of Phe-tRNA-synthetase-like protein
MVRRLTHRVLENMTNERIRRFRIEHLEYLEGDRADPPEVETLSEEDWPRARAWLKSLEAARGIDPYAERPSTDELLKRIK